MTRHYHCRIIFLTLWATVQATLLRAEPITQDSVFAFHKRIAEALEKQDTLALRACFADDATIAIEFLTPKGSATKSFTGSEYATYLEHLFPTAFKRDFSVGAYAINVAGGGATASIFWDAGQKYEFPEGEAYFQLKHSYEVIKRGDAILISSLKVTRRDRRVRSLSERREN